MVEELKVRYFIPQDIGKSWVNNNDLLCLLDGLDEVRSQDHDRVLNTIRQTAEKFDASQFVITCRIAAKEYIFEQFTEVEVADFDDEQIADFCKINFGVTFPLFVKDAVRGDKKQAV